MRFRVVSLSSLVVLRDRRSCIEALANAVQQMVDARFKSPRARLLREEL